MGRKNNPKKSEAKARGSRRWLRELRKIARENSVERKTRNRAKKVVIT